MTQDLLPSLFFSPHLVNLALLLLGGLVATLLVHLLLGHLGRLAGRTQNPWDDALLKAGRGPLVYGIWLLGVAGGAELLWAGDSADGGWLQVFRHLAVILLLCLFLLRLTGELEKDFLARQADVTTTSAVARLLRISVLVLALVMALGTLGISISGVLAFGGIGGLAVGFAAKDLLANFFGGLMLYLDRPFKVGDWVRSPDREIEGTVESIGWRQTVIRTFDMRPLYVPNSIFASVSVENPSRMQNRRIYETIGIRYRDAGRMGVIIDSVKAMLEAHPEIDPKRTLIVNFNAFAPSSLDFFIYTFTRTTDWVKFHEIKQDVLLRILEIIESQGAETAFPTSTLHLASMPSALEESA